MCTVITAFEDEDALTFSHLHLTQSILHFYVI